MSEPPAAACSAPALYCCFVTKTKTKIYFSNGLAFLVIELKLKLKYQLRFLVIKLKLKLKYQDLIKNCSKTKKLANYNKYCFKT